MPDKPAQRTKFFIVGDNNEPETKDFVVNDAGGGGGIWGSGLILKKSIKYFN